MLIKEFIIIYNLNNPSIMGNCSTSKPKEKPTKPKEDKLTKISTQIDHIVSGENKILNVMKVVITMILKSLDN